MIKVDGVTSDLVTVPCGIPQRSVHVPILFYFFCFFFYVLMNFRNVQVSLISTYFLMCKFVLRTRHKIIAILRHTLTLVTRHWYELTFNHVRQTKRSKYKQRALI